MEHTLYTLQEVQPVNDQVRTPGASCVNYIEITPPLPGGLARGFGEAVLAATGSLYNVKAVREVLTTPKKHLIQLTMVGTGPGGIREALDCMAQFIVMSGAGKAEATYSKDESTVFEPKA